MNGKANIFNIAIENIPSNYIPLETFFCDDGAPPWINKDIEQLNLKKNQGYKFYLRSNKFLHFINQFYFLQAKLNCLIEKLKENF